jgi:predicted HAD superfamily Cof-like phosphohydrolase
MVVHMASRETELLDHGTAQSHDGTSAVQAMAPAVTAAETQHTIATKRGGLNHHKGVSQNREREAEKPCQSVGSQPEALSGELSDAMACVASFHEAFGLPRAARPDAEIPAELAKLRVDLLVEETGEFAEASARSDIVGIADALADIVYVAYGAAVTYGIDLDAALREVHRSNMSKLDDRGRPIYREDGKVLKSSRYTPPDISGILSRQPRLPF